MTPVTHPAVAAAELAVPFTLPHATDTSATCMAASAVQSRPRSDTCVHVQTSIVGRRFRTNITCNKHTQVALVRQPDNARDGNAIQVIDTARQAILGYLPREISQHLSGLLDEGFLQISASVDEPKSGAAPAPILLEVCTHILFLLWQSHSPP